MGQLEMLSGYEIGQLNTTSSEERERRRHQISLYLAEKVPGISCASQHQPKQMLDVHFSPLRCTYFSKVVLPGLYHLLDSFNGLGHLFAWRHLNMAEDDCGIFLRCYWALISSDPGLFNHWPESTLAWATQEERDAIVAEGSLLSAASPVWGKDGYFITPGEEELEEAVQEKPDTESEVAARR